MTMTSATMVTVVTRADGHATVDRLGTTAIDECLHARRAHTHTRPHTHPHTHTPTHTPLAFANIYFVWRACYCYCTARVALIP